MAERTDPFLPDETVPGTDSIEPTQVAQLDLRGTTALTQIASAPPAPAPRNPYAFTPPAGFQMPDEPPPLGIPNVGRGRTRQPAPQSDLISADDADARLARFKQAIEFEQDPGQGVGAARTALGAFAGGFSSAVSEPLRFAGATAADLSGEKPEDSRLFNWGTSIKKAVENAFPTNPQSRDNLLLYVIPQGLGQIAGMVTVAAATAKGAVVAGAGALGAAGISVGTRVLPWVFRGVGTGIGVATSGAEGFDDAVKHGASLDDAFTSMYLNGATGLTEFIPVMRGMSAADARTGGLMTRALRQYVKNPVIASGLRTGVDEAIQETFQQIAQNFIASGIVKYDEQRGIFENTEDAAAGGFSVGSIYGMLMAMVPGRSRGAQQGTPSPNPPNTPPGQSPTGQLPPPSGGTGPSTPSNPELPSPGGGRGSYFDLPPPPSNADFLSGQISRLESIDTEAKANDPLYTGDANIGETIQFFRYLQKSEADFERLRGMDPVSRQMPQNELLAQEVAANRELIELLKDPIRMVSRPTYVLQEPGRGRTPGKVHVLDTDEQGNVIYKKNGAWVRTRDGRDIKVSEKSQVRRIDDTRPENLAMSPVGQKMVREARARMAADRARLQAELDARMAEQRNDPRSAKKNRDPLDAIRALERPVQDRPDSAPGPMQSVEEAAMSAAGENQAKSRERAKQDTAETLTAASQAVRGNPGRFIAKEDLPGHMRQRLEARAIQLGQPVPDVLQKDDLLAAGLPENEVSAMFARRDSVARLEAQAEAEDAARARRRENGTRPMRGTGIHSFISLIPESNTRARRAVGNMLRHWKKLLGPQFDKIKVIDLAAWLRRDPQALRRMGGRGDESAVFLGNYLVKLADRINNAEIALNSGRSSIALRDIAHELTHALIYMRGMSGASLTDLWNKVSESAANGTLDPASKQVYDQVARDYADAPADVRAEEFLAFTVENFMAGRYETRADFRAQNGEPYTWADQIHDFIVGLYRMVRDTFNGVVKRDVLNDFLRNIENTYGVSVLEPAPPPAEPPTQADLEARFSRRVDTNERHSPFYSGALAQLDIAIQNKSVPMTGFGRDYRGMFENWSKQGLVNREELNWTMIDGEVGVLEWLSKPENAGQRFSINTIRDLMAQSAVKVYATPPLVDSDSDGPFDWPSERNGETVEPSDDYIDEEVEYYMGDGEYFKNALENYDSLFETVTDHTERVLKHADPDGTFSKAFELYTGAKGLPARITDEAQEPSDLDDLRTDMRVLADVLDRADEFISIYEANQKLEDGSTPQSFRTYSGALAITPTAEQVAVLTDLKNRKVSPYASVTLIGGRPRINYTAYAFLADYPGKTLDEVARHIGTYSSTVEQVQESTALELATTALSDLHSTLDSAYNTAEEAAREAAYESARESAYENAETEWTDSNTGWSIIGNNDVGYRVLDENGSQVAEVSSRGGYSEAQIAALEAYRERNPSSSAGRGARWGGYLGDYDGEIEDDTYAETLLVWDTDKANFTDTAHWDAEDKNVVAFARHAQLKLAVNTPQGNTERVTTTFMLEGQSDWSKEDTFSRLAKQRVDEINAQLTSLYAQVEADLTDIFASTPELSTRVRAMTDGQSVIETFTSSRAYQRMLGDMSLEGSARSDMDLVGYAEADAAAAGNMPLTVAMTIHVLAPVISLAKFGDASFQALTRIANTLTDAATIHEQLRAEREGVLKFAEGATDPGPFVGNRFEKIAQSWVMLLAKYHIWRAVADGTDAISWTTGASSAEMWNTRTFDRVKVRLVDQAVLPDRDRAKQEAEARGVLARDPSNPTRLLDLGMSYEGATVLRLRTPPMFEVTFWNNDDTRSVPKYVADRAELSATLGPDILAAVDKRGLNDGQEVTLRMGVDVPQTYVTDRMKDGKTVAGYRVIYDKMYRDAIREIFKALNWSQKGQDPIQLASGPGSDGRPANDNRTKTFFARIPDEGVEFIKSRGVEAMPTFGKRFDKPATMTPPGADPNLQNDPDIGAGDGTSARFARRAVDVPFDDPNPKDFPGDRDPKEAANIARGRSAMQRVLSALSEGNPVTRVARAMYRQAIGWIDFHAGSRAYGINHVTRIAERKPVAERIPEIIAKGIVGPYYIRPALDPRFERLRRNIVLNGETVVISPIFDDKLAPMLVTARPATANMDDAFYDRSAGGIPVSDADAQAMIEAASKGSDAYREIGARIRAEAGNIPLVGDMSGMQARFARRSDVPPTYSGLYRAIEKSDRKRAPAGVWQAWLKEATKRGATEAEIQWTGLREWLRTQKGEIKRDDVLDFLRRAEVRIEEVTLTDKDAINEEALAENRAKLTERRDSARQSYDQLVANMFAGTPASMVQRRDDAIDNIFNVVESASYLEDTYYSDGAEGYAESRDTLLKIPGITEEKLDHLERTIGVLVARQRDLNDLEDQVEQAAQNIWTYDNDWMRAKTTTRWGRDNYNSELLELPGRRTDYRELVFTWKPKIDQGVVVYKAKDGKWSAVGGGVSIHGAPSEEDARAFAVSRLVDTRFKHLHWDGIENPIFHARFNMRVDKDGKNVLFIEEIQSDWHTSGRSAGTYRDADKLYVLRQQTQVAVDAVERMRRDIVAGMKADPRYQSDYEFGEDAVQAVMFDVREYGDKPTLEKYAKAASTRGIDQQRMQARLNVLVYMQEKGLVSKYVDLSRRMYELSDQQRRVERAPPRAPFDGGDPVIVGFVMKRLLRWAIDNGATRVAWAPGVVQAMRYGLDNHVSKIEFARNPRGARGGLDTYAPTAYDLDGNVIDLSGLRAHGIDPAAMTLDNIKDTFGTPVSQAVNLRGAWKNDRMTYKPAKSGEDKAKRELYDNIVPNAVRSILRSFGLPDKLTTSVIPTERVMLDGNKGWDGSDVEAQAVDLGPELTDAALDLGFARFARRGQTPPPPPPGPGTGGANASPQNWFQRMVAWIGRHDPIFTQTSQRIRAVGGTRASYELGNEFRRDIHQRTAPGQTGMIGEDFHSTINGLNGRFMTRLSDMLDALPESALRVLPDVLRGTYLNPQTGRITIPANSGLTAQQAQAFRQYLNDVLDFANQHMAGNGPLSGAKGSAYVTAQDLIGKIANYYPQQWMLDGAFTDGQLAGVERTAAAMEFFKAAGIYSNAADQTAKIREMMNNIQGLYGFVSYASSSVGPIGRSYFLANNTLKRVLSIDPAKTFQITVDGKQFSVRLSDFLHNDPAHTLVSYTHGMMRHAEWVRRFGPKGQVIDDYMKRIDAERVAAGKNPLTPDEQAIIVRAIQSNVGGLKAPNRTLDNMQQWTQVVGNAIYLSLSTLSSLPELVMPAVRTGVTGQLYAYRAGLKSLFQLSGVSKDRQFARELGIIHEEAHIALQNSVADYGNFRIQKWNQRIFSAIGLNLFTRWTQTMSAAAARYSLPGWARRANAGSNKHVRWLAEVGLTAADLANYDADNYQPGSNAKIDAALRQMASEMVINPTQAAKAAWMNDPRFRLVSHIKSYMWGFNNTILQRVGRETVQGNPMPLIFLMGTIALAGMLAELREWLTWGEEGNPALNKLRESGDPTLIWMYQALDRGGALSHLQLPINILTQTRAGSSGTWTGAIVPAVGLMDNALKTARGSLFYMATGDEKELRMAVDGASRFVPGLVWTGSAVAFDTNRADFVDALAPKATRGNTANNNANPRGVAGQTGGSGSRANSNPRGLSDR